MGHRGALAAACSSTLDGTRPTSTLPSSVNSALTIRLLSTLPEPQLPLTVGDFASSCWSMPRSAPAVANLRAARDVVRGYCAEVGVSYHETGLVRSWRESLAQLRAEPDAVRTRR